jgi:hypothetical protein
MQGGQDKYANISPQRNPFHSLHHGWNICAILKRFALPSELFLSQWASKSRWILPAFSNICSAAHTRSIFELGTWAALVSTSLYFPKNGSEKWAKPFAVDEYACGWYTKGDSEAQKILNEMSAANKF